VKTALLRSYLSSEVPVPTHVRRRSACGLLLNVEEIRLNQKCNDVKAAEEKWRCSEAEATSGYLESLSQLFG